MTEIMGKFISDFETLVTAAMSLLAIVFVAMTWMRTKSLAPTIGAVLLGAVVLWGVNNYPTLQREINEDVTQNGG